MIKKRGYTIIELMVAIAIILILAAILFAAGFQARGLALRSSCANSLAQLSKATLMYNQDYDGMPPLENGIKDRSGLAPYLKSTVPTCPSIIIEAPISGYAGYCFNIWHLESETLNEVIKNRQKTIDNPASASLIWESRPGDYANGGVQPCDFHPKTPECAKTGAWHDRHLGVGNVAFADGHIKAYSAKDLRLLTQSTP